MKKTTILAVSLVVVAVLAVWFYRDQVDDEESPATAAVISAPPAVEDVPPADVEPITAPVEIAAPTSTVRMEAGYQPALFGDPRDRDDQFFFARVEGQKIVNASTLYPVIRARLLQAHPAAMPQFLAQTNMTNGFTAPVEISPFPDVPCVLSSVIRTDIDQWATYAISGTCGPDGTTNVRGRVDTRRNTIMFDVWTANGSYEVIPIPETDYWMALELDKPREPRGR